MKKRYSTYIAAAVFTLALCLFGHRVGFGQGPSLGQKNKGGGGVVAEQSGAGSNGNLDVHPSGDAPIGTQVEGGQIGTGNENSTRERSEKKGKDIRKGKRAEITIDQQVIDQLAFGEADLVGFKLFDGETIQVKIGNRQINSNTGTIIHGDVEGEESSQVILSIFEHAMFGKIQFEDGRVIRVESVPEGKNRYEIYEENAVAILRHLNVPKFRHTRMMDGVKVEAIPCFSTLVPKGLSLDWGKQMLAGDRWRPAVQFVSNSENVRRRVELRMPFKNTEITDKTGNVWVVSKSGQWKKKFVPPTGSGRPSSGPAMNIGMVYTPQTEILLGDRAKVQAKAGLWVAALGVGLKDSGLSVTTTQAGAIFKISQDFDGRTQMNACLDYISSAKEVADFRDQNKADLVAGILEGDPSGAGVVGLAWLLPDIKGKKSAAFGVSWHSTDEITFSHECGHNMGLGHDPSQGAKGILPNSWGNHFTHKGKGWCTIQAYQKAGFYNRALIFSGPNVKYEGTTTTGSANEDSVGTIRQTGPAISNYYK